MARAGRVTVAEIGIPTELATAHGVTLAVLEAADAAGGLPRAGLLDHKNRRGHALVVAGGAGKRGAARLSSMAALRSGAGLVTLAWEGREIPAPDPIMTAELDAEAPDAIDRLVALAEGKRVVAIGPGMSTGPGGRALVRAALERLEVPMVLDADALNHLAGELERVAESRAPVVLTPHPGEAARLLGTGTADIERDRVAAVRELAERSRAVVLLKGAGTLVCDGEAADGFVTINPTGNPALATAGAGDVLTGVIAGLMAQGRRPAMPRGSAPTCTGWPATCIAIAWARSARQRRTSSTRCPTRWRGCAPCARSLARPGVARGSPGKSFAIPRALRV